MELLVTEYAISHLVESVELTLQRASATKRAEVIDRVLDELGQLLQHPGAGQIEPWLEGATHEYRRLVVGRFKVIYRIDGNRILVTDIFDTRQDPRRMRR